VGESRPAQYALLLIAASIVGLLFAVRQGEKRWRAEGIDLDDKVPSDGDLGMAPAPAARRTP
jgi:hypothetical protein